MEGRVHAPHPGAASHLGFAAAHNTRSMWQRNKHSTSHTNTAIHTKSETPEMDFEAQCKFRVCTWTLKMHNFSATYWSWPPPIHRPCLRPCKVNHHHITTQTRTMVHSEKLATLCYCFTWLIFGSSKPTKKKLCSVDNKTDWVGASGCEWVRVGASGCEWGWWPYQSDGRSASGSAISSSSSSSQSEGFSAAASSIISGAASSLKVMQ